MMHDEEGMYDPVSCPLNPDFNHEDHEAKKMGSGLNFQQMKELFF
jgi:hypothetical protein